MAKRFTAGYMSNQMGVLWKFVRRGIWPQLFLTSGVAGAGLLWAFGDDRRRELGLMIFGWVVGVLGCSVGVFLVDHAIARASGGLPVQISLVRGVRYLVPLSFLLFLLGLHTALGRLAPRLRYPAIAVVWLAVFCMAMDFWGRAPRNTGHLVPRGARIVAGRVGLIRPVPKYKPHILGAVQALKTHTDQGATILPIDVNPTAVRYSALRPVPFCRKDAGVLSYTDPRELVTWHRRMERMEALNNLEPGVAKVDGLLVFARYVDADYMIIRTKPVLGQEDATHPDIIWRNPRFALLRVPPDVP